MPFDLNPVVRNACPTGTKTNGENRICWLCLETELENPEVEWVAPCQCIGSTKWIHRECLTRFYQQKQAENPMSLVECPQCTFVYHIYYPHIKRLRYCYKKLYQFIRGCYPKFTGNAQIQFMEGSSPELYQMCLQDTYDVYLIVRCSNLNQGIVLVLDYLDTAVPLVIRVPKEDKSVGPDEPLPESPTDQ